MGWFTLTDLARFPIGTSVSVYKAEQAKQGQAPSGSSSTSGTMAAGGVTFTGLEDNREYVAYAVVSAQHRYSGFKSQPDEARGNSDRGRIEALEARVHDEVAWAHDDRWAGGVDTAASDNATALAAWLTAIDNSNKGRGVIPAGTFDVGSKLTPPDGSILSGAGEAETVLRVKAGASIAGGLFEATNAQHLELTDLTIDLNAANTTSLGQDTQQQAIYFISTTTAGTARCALRRVKVKDAERVGIYSTSDATNHPNELVLEDVTVTGCGRQGILVARPSRLRANRVLLDGNCTGNATDQFQVGISASDGGSNIILAAVEAINGGRSGMTLLGVTEFQLLAPRAEANGVTAAVALTGHGIVISEGCRGGSIVAPHTAGNYASNIVIDPRTAGASTLKDMDVTVDGGSAIGSVTSHGFYVQYSKGVRVNGMLSRGNADDGFKLVSCLDVFASGTARGNTGHGLSIVDGTGTGSGPGGKNICQVHCAGNGTDTVEDTAGTSSDTTLCTTD